ncbi:MAG: hypothetical protein JW809_06355 [Pirellulales bacterium]|nr:hypothetical protein [Pirellulales bacterium]
MKCPVCWAEKAYVRRVDGWKGKLLALFLIVPMQCHHCYHRFHVLWFQTWGKRTQPPLRIAPNTRATRLSYAARHVAAQGLADPASRESCPARRVDAA